MHPETLTVALGDRSYPLHFSASAVAAVRGCVKSLRAEGRKVAVISNRRIAQVQAKALAAMFGRAGVPRYLAKARQGEALKSLPEMGKVLDFLAAHRLDRTSVVFVVGGGVIGDLGGFAAACYLRGIDYYQIPTTLLAMVDSSVGGKTGVNLPAGKNLVGAFHQPRGVFIGTNFLATLPPREFAAGMAEVIKTALLGDAELFSRLEANRLTLRSHDLAAVIRRCCALKAQIVQADERELRPDGGRALLNLGHTFGHAIEQVAGYGRYRGTYLHGEAVAIGLVAAARLSERLGLAEPAAGDAAGANGGGLAGRIERVLDAHRLPIRLRKPLPMAKLMAAMSRDKKVRSGALRFIVLRAVGQAEVESRVDPRLVKSIWRKVQPV